ncbi:MAG: S-adenosyl-l-methionine hydroxide adenosyltransferase family protein [Anaerolineales bacterium]
MTPTIALLTDFGTQDTYVSAMKGVIMSLNPQVRIVDITHHIPRGNIQRAAFELWRVQDYFPEETIFLCVVDPGVGTIRRGLAISCGKRTYVGPDNGLFTYVHLLSAQCTAVELQNPGLMLTNVSRTFHGRDVFAPAAAHLSRGVELDAFGPQVTDVAHFPLPLLRSLEDVEILGEVLHADQFGNIITSIGILEFAIPDLILKPWLLNAPELRFPYEDLRLHLPGPLSLRLNRTFDEVPVGEAVAYIGSAGLLEIGINQGSADDTLGLTPGQQISLTA